MSDLSVLRLICSQRECPSEEAARARLEPFAASVAAPEPGASGWTQAWRSPEGDEHLLELEPHEARSAGTPLLLAPLPGREKRRIRAARWRLVLATRLGREDPLAAFGRQLRFATIACPDAVGVHDLCSGNVWSGEHVRTVASWTTPPPATELYQVHAVRSLDPGGGWWVHTHGLRRTGLPDVELLRVPAELAEAAAEAIRTFVRGHMGRDVGPCGETVGFFHGHRLAWIPAERAARALGPSDVGRIADRIEAGAHDGPRIALVEPRRWGRGRWRPPIRLLRELLANRAVARVPPEESDRAAALARERWPVFLRLFAAHRRDDGWHFDVCSALGTGPRGPEFLWWEVAEVEAERVRLRLLTPALHDPALVEGAERWCDLASIADWTVTTPTATVRPDTVRVPA